MISVFGFAFSFLFGCCGGFACLFVVLGFSCGLVILVLPLGVWVCVVVLFPGMVLYIVGLLSYLWFGSVY